MKTTIDEAWQVLEFPRIKILSSNKNFDAAGVFDNNQRSRTVLSSIINGTSLIGLRQVHSSHVVFIDQSTVFEGLGGHQRIMNPADGIVVTYETMRSRSISLLLTTADCLPVVVASENWCALLHCGWKGIYLGIVESLYRCIAGSKLSTSVDVWVGPSICRDCFEVGEEFKDYFPDTFTQTLCTNTSGERMICRVDLQSELKNRFLDCFDICSWSGAQHCTYHDSSHHSYRLLKQRYSGDSRLFSYPLGATVLSAT